jgi:hypothetical protein
MFTNHLRAKLGATFLVLAFALSAAPARADFGLNFRFAVGAAPAAPATPEPVADSLNGNDGYKQPCGDTKLQWIVYGTQIFNALVVSNAVNKGSHGVTIFGTSRTVWPYLGELGVEDFVVRNITRRWSCKERSLVQGALGASALNNAANTEFPR